MSMIGQFVAIPQEELDVILKEPDSAFSILGKYPENDIDLDKAWHGIHFLLNGEPYGGEYPLVHAVFGMEKIEEQKHENVNPMFGTPAKNVKEIADAICSINEEQFRAKYDQKALQDAAIYPDSWNDPEKEMDFLTSYFEDLQEFYKEAASKNLAVITYIQ